MCRGVLILHYLQKSSHSKTGNNFTSKRARGDRKDKSRPFPRGAANGSKLNVDVLYTVCVINPMICGVCIIWYGVQKPYKNLG